MGAVISWWGLLSAWCIRNALVMALSSSVPRMSGLWRSTVSSHAHTDVGSSFEYPSGMWILYAAGRSIIAVRWHGGPFAHPHHPSLAARAERGGFGVGGALPAVPGGGRDRPQHLRLKRIPTSR